MKKRLLSGMRPTGKLHLGHLVGALDNWAKLQGEHDCFFMVADWHAFMSEYKNPKNIRDNIVDNVIDWIACGIDPKRSVIFVQSDVPEHLELFMILSNITPLSWLERCPTYKDQLKELKAKEINSHGFLGYPVLQAADILVYKANVVPVGEDQLAHLELAREIVRRFHSLYAKVFPEPEALLTKSSRLLGLDNRKMSKSYNNTIELSASDDVIGKKVQSMITDPARIKRTDPGHPEICNIHSYYAVFKPEEKANIDKACRAAEIGCTECKKRLGDIIVDVLAPIKEKRDKLLKNKNKVSDILESGAKKARKITSSVMKEVREAVSM